MSENLTVSEVARTLHELTGIEVRPRDISDLLYKRILQSARCPILGGRRLIPRDYISEIERVLRNRGLLRNPVEEMKG